MQGKAPWPLDVLTGLHSLYPVRDPQGSPFWTSLTGVSSQETHGVATALAELHGEVNLYTIDKSES